MLFDAVFRKNGLHSLWFNSKFFKKAVLSQGNRAMPRYPPHLYSS